MIVYKLTGYQPSFDYASFAKEVEIGLFLTKEKAEAKIEEIKLKCGRELRMHWEQFYIKEVVVE